MFILLLLFPVLDSSRKPFIKYYIYELEGRSDRKFYVFQLNELNRKTGVLLSHGQLAVGPDGISIITTVRITTVNLGIIYYQFCWS